jgi:hypothetical protein
MPTFDTPEPISITLDLSVAQIWIDASERADTVVEVSPSHPEKQGDITAAAQTRVEYANGQLTVKMPKTGWRQWTPWGGDESIDLHLGVPTGSNLQGGAAVGALRTTGRLGECSYKTSASAIQLDQAGPLKLRTAAGDVTVTRALGDAEISTASGGLRISDIEGGAVIRNSNGDTWIGEVTGDARVNAANGRIAVDRAHAGLAAKTANGDIRLGEVRRGQILAETACGKVDIGVLDGVAAWLDLNTHFGTVQSELDPSSRPVSGEDTVQVRARSSMGDITVRRAADVEVKDA